MGAPSKDLTSNLYKETTNSNQVLLPDTETCEGDTTERRIVPKRSQTGVEVRHFNRR